MVQGATAPVSEIFRTATGALVPAVLCRVGPDVLYALFTVFVLTYVTTQLSLPRNVGLTAVENVRMRRFGMTEKKNTRLHQGLCSPLAAWR